MQKNHILYQESWPRLVFGSYGISRPLPSQNVNKKSNHVRMCPWIHCDEQKTSTRAATTFYDFMSEFPVISPTENIQLKMI